MANNNESYWLVEGLRTMLRGKPTSYKGTQSKYILRHKVWVHNTL